jgi:L-aspartate oxidase
MLRSHAMKRVERPSLEQFELRNIHTVALLIALSALARDESRGAHFRSDFPAPRREFEKHSRIMRGHDVTFQ